MLCNHTAFCIPLTCVCTVFVRIFLALVHVVLIVERSGNRLPLCDLAAAPLWFLSLTFCEKSFASQSEGAFAVPLAAAAAFRLPFCRHPFSFSSFKFGGMTDCIGTIRYLIQEPNLVPMEGASVLPGLASPRFFTQQRVHLLFLSGSPAHKTC
jgi:hypothetical protein